MGKSIILLTCSMVFTDSKADKLWNRCDLPMCHLQLCKSSRDAKTFCRIWCCVTCGPVVVDGWLGRPSNKTRCTPEMDGEVMLPYSVDSGGGPRYSCLILWSTFPTIRKSSLICSK
jgi:hypothetical protein